METNDWIDRMISWADDLDLKEEDFPRDRSRIIKIKELRLRNYKILPSIPAEIGKIQSLEKLDIESGSNEFNREFSHLPPEICDLKQLKYLDIQITYLTALPENIGNLRNLKRLYIDGPYLKELPKSIGELSSLEVLTILIDGSLALPENIGNLKNLKRLYIYGPNTTELELPISIGDLSSLEELYINPYPIAFTYHPVSQCL